MQNYVETHEKILFRHPGLQSFVLITVEIFSYLCRNLSYLSQISCKLKL